VLAVGFAGSVAAGPFEDAGTAYMKGDYARASRLLRPLAEQGNADAQARLTLIDVGAAYRKGHYETAARLVRPLAEQGNVDAQARLAYLYANGEGVPQDYEAAVGWYQKAAEQGNAIAQYNLGDMYRVGEGVSGGQNRRRGVRRDDHGRSVIDQFDRNCRKTAVADRSVEFKPHVFALEKSCFGETLAECRQIPKAISKVYEPDKRHRFLRPRGDRPPCHASKPPSR
jgi:TPR repeat protein